MREFTIFAAMAVILACAVSCKKGPEPGKEGIDASEAFLLKEEVGVYGSVPLFVFDADAHEIVYNVKTSRMTVHDDNLEELLCVEFLPSGADGYSVTITGVDTPYQGAAEMKLLRTKEDLAWLWDAGQGLGVIVLKGD